MARPAYSLAGLVPVCVCVCLFEMERDRERERLSNRENVRAGGTRSMNLHIVDSMKFRRSVYDFTKVEERVSDFITT